MYTLCSNCSTPLEGPAFADCPGCGRSAAGRFEVADTLSGDVVEDPMSAARAVAGKSCGTRRPDLEAIEFGGARTMPGFDEWDAQAHPDPTSEELDRQYRQHFSQMDVKEALAALDQVAPGRNSLKYECCWRNGKQTASWFAFITESRQVCFCRYGETHGEAVRLVIEERLAALPSAAHAA